jgi:cytoskeletal protein RodZ
VIGGQSIILTTLNLAFSPCPVQLMERLIMMEQNQRPRFRFRLRTLLLVVVILALLLVVIVQQVQISRQQGQIRQMRQQIDKFLIQQDKLQEIIRTQRDLLERQR